MVLVESEILKALVELDEAVKAMPTANPKPNLLPYQKARLFLEGRDEENAAGNCRHV
jgi:hypothetical protein